MKNLACTAILFTALLCGCATIVGDKTQVIPITSVPSDASFLITDEAGVHVFKGTTPSRVTLEKSDGSYWGGQSYTVEISKEGYESQSVRVTPSVTGWYIGGNLLFGGVIGWFLVDPHNGGMYTLSPKKISVTLNQ